MITKQEIPVYVAELVANVAYATYLQSLKRAYEPDWTWATVVGGVALSAIPAMTLARRDPATDWRAYERRTVAGFLTSGVVIIGWQLWQAARRQGRAEGYALAHRVPPSQEHEDADTARPLGPTA